MSFNEERLQTLGIDLEELKERFQVLCLPENTIAEANETELYETTDSIDLYKNLIAASVKCGNSLDIGLEAKILERRAADIWLGLVIILDDIVIPILASVIASIIYSKINKSKEIMHSSKHRISLELWHLQEDSIKKIKFDGKSEDLLNLLSGIENEKESE